jgi:hypothetical protein
MPIDLNNVRAVFVRQIENWVEMLPEDVRQTAFFGAANADEPLTPEGILQHVKEETDLGNQLVEQAIALAAANALEASASPEPETAGAGAGGMTRTR